MKKIVGILMVAICLVSVPVWADDHDLAATSQLQLSADHIFWEDSNVSGYVNGIFHLDLDSGWPILFGYAGPMVKAGKVNIYPLFVTMSDPSGWSVGPSLWLEYAGDKHYLFAEYDHYEPFLSSQHGEFAVLPPHAYYGLAEYNYSLAEKAKVGAELEIYGLYDDDHMSELAYGPYVSMGNIKVWLFYDETPMVPGDNYLGLRFKLSI